MDKDGWSFPDRTPFQKLAAVFHQDCHLLFSTFVGGLDLYLANLSPEERRLLRADLRGVLDANLTEGAFRSAFFKAGAEWRASGVKIRDAMLRFLDRL